MNRSDRTHNELVFGGLDGDTEINGCAYNDQFTDIVWIAASQDHGAFPPFYLSLGSDDIVCDDIVVPGEEEVEVACEPEVEFA